MTTFGAKCAGDILVVIPQSGIVRFAHCRISMTDAAEPSVACDRHGEDGRPRTEGGRYCIGVSVSPGTRRLIAGKRTRSSGDFDWLAGVGPKREQIVGRFRCSAGGADDGAIILA